MKDKINKIILLLWLISLTANFYILHHNLKTLDRQITEYANGMFRNMNRELYNLNLTKQDKKEFMMKNKKRSKHPLDPNCCAEGENPSCSIGQGCYCWY